MILRKYYYFISDTKWQMFGKKNGPPILIMRVVNCSQFKNYSCMRKFLLMSCIVGILCPVCKDLSSKICMYERCRVLFFLSISFSTLSQKIDTVETLFFQFTMQFQVLQFFIHLQKFLNQLGVMHFFKYQFRLCLVLICWFLKQGQQVSFLEVFHTIDIVCQIFLILLQRK